jgi:hypothetical protein
MGRRHFWHWTYRSRDAIVVGMTTVDTTRLRAAFDALLAAAADPSPEPPPGEWDADQILAHVVLVNAATITALCSVTAGAVATYDNRLTQDPWTLRRVIALAGGTAGLRERIRGQGEALCALAGAALSDAELDTPVPALLLSNGSVLVDQPIPLRAILTGLADVELPGHTDQLRR